MMNPTFALLTAGILILVLTGCGPSTNHNSAQESTHDHGSENHANEGAFNPGKGLRVTPVAMASLGVAIEEVGNGRVTLQRTLTAQVFRQADEKSVNGRYRQGYAYATVLLPSEDKDLVQTGRLVRLSNGNGIAMEGRISRMDTQLQELNGQSELIIEIAPGNDALAIGSSLTLQLSQVPEKTEATIIIPEEAILKTAKGSFVYVENAGFYLKTPVRTGAVSEGKIQVLEGLFEGDIVVVRGTQGLYLTELQAVNAGTGCTHGH